MVRRHELRIDVSDAVPWPGSEVAVTLVVPDGEVTGPRTLAFGFPGGGYARGYWDIQWAGSEGYSQAAHHAERGWLFAAVDHLGVGDSSQPDPSGLTFESLAAANDSAARSAVDGLRAGTLVDDLGPVAITHTIGMGQSMGACLTIVAQGIHRTFDAVAVLGFSAIHAVIPSPAGGVDAAEIVSSVTTDVFKWAFHWDDVEPEVRAADMGDGYPMRIGRVPPWGSATIPSVAVSMLSPGIVAKEAAAIDVPVFVGMGERDVCPDPWAEPSSYAGSTDVTLVVVPCMAHMHNFAGTRHRLWNRLHAWGSNLPNLG